MANKDITESGVQEVLRTMGIPTSFEGLQQGMIGRAETLATLGTGMGASAVGGLAGLAELARTGDLGQATNMIRQAQDALTYMPRSQAGAETLQSYAPALEALGVPSEYVGGQVLEATGSPALATGAEMFGDPLNFIPGLKGIAASAPLVAKVAKGTKFAKPSVKVDVGVPEEALDLAAEEAIRAFHGSPYDFEKFDLSKIGTGEGAQAYGYGLYFTESPDVARGYRRDVSMQRMSDQIVPINDEVAAELDRVTNVADMAFLNIKNEAVYEHGGVPTKEQLAATARRKASEVSNEYYADAYKKLEQMILDDKFTMAEQPTDLAGLYDKLTGPKATDLDYEKAAIVEQIMIDGDVLGVIQRQSEGKAYSDKAFKWFEKEIQPTYKAPGALYEVDVKATQDELLNYEKPFSEQSERVQKAIQEVLEIPYEDSAMYRQLESKGFSKDDITRYKEAYERRVGRAREGIADPNIKGSLLYDRISDVMGTNQKEASEALNRAGVKGIKYADGLSRGKEGGTSNFVVFDPRIIEIARKYGVALPVAGYILSQTEGQQQQGPEA